MPAFLRPIIDRFRSPAAPASGPPAFALLMTLLLFAVVNAFRHPPHLLDVLDQSTGGATKNVKFVDDLFLKLTANGNILLRFKNFDYSHDDLQPRATFEYIRASYAVYPKRVYVADDATLIPQAYTGDPFPGFDPAPDWIDQHHIIGLVTAEQATNGTTRYYEIPREKL